VFGMDDELKVAPKGIDKGHKYVLPSPFVCVVENLIIGIFRDIDLLKCRSFAVFLQ
jgi:hypothetical protein